MPGSNAGICNVMWVASAASTMEAPPLSSLPVASTTQARLMDASSGSLNQSSTCAGVLVSSALAAGSERTSSAWAAALCAALNTTLHAINTLSHPRLYLFI
ncbi:MAG: hypothetical protein R2911_27730 [Caldilineaceae bacterium]